MKLISIVVVDGMLSEKQQKKFKLVEFRSRCRMDELSDEGIWTSKENVETRDLLQWNILIMSQS